VSLRSNLQSIRLYTVCHVHLTACDYYAAVFINRITSLPRPSVCLSVCPLVRSSRFGFTQKFKKHTKNWCKRPLGRNTQAPGVPIFRLKDQISNLCDVKKKQKKMTHISRQCLQASQTHLTQRSARRCTSGLSKLTFKISAV